MTISLDRILIAVLVVATCGSFLVLQRCGVILPWAAILSIPACMAFTVMTILSLVAVAWLFRGGPKASHDDKG